MNTPGGREYGYIGRATQTLQQFVKNLPDKKGIEKNLWAKKYINRIEYSPEEISISLYYKRDFAENNLERKASGRVGATACLLPSYKKEKPQKKDEGSFRMAAHMKSDQTIEIIIPNRIHGSREKNL